MVSATNVAGTARTNARLLRLRTLIRTRILGALLPTVLQQPPLILLLDAVPVQEDPLALAVEGKRAPVLVLVEIVPAQQVVQDVVDTLQPRGLYHHVLVGEILAQALAMERRLHALAHRVVLAVNVGISQILLRVPVERQVEIMHVVQFFFWCNFEIFSNFFAKILQVCQIFFGEILKGFQKILAKF